MKSSSRILITLVLFFASFTASAQVAVDIGLFNTAPDTLEVRLRPDASFSGIVSNVVFTIRWQANSGVNLGVIDESYPEIAYIPMAKSGIEVDSNGFRYQVFAGFGFFPMSNFGAAWAAGQEVVLMRIPILNGTSFYEIVNDSWTGSISNNGEYFVSLGGINSTGIIYNSGTGSCPGVSSWFTNKITPATARLNWQAATGAYSYRIRGKNVLNSFWKYLDAPHGSPNFFNVNNLHYNNTYVWQVKAICDSAGNDLGPWSGLDTFVTLCQEPDSVWTDPVSSSGATFNWNPVSGAAAYDIRGRKLGATWVTLLVGSFNTSKTVFGLEPSTTYEWAVRTWCDSLGQRKSAFSSRDTFTTTSLARLAKLPGISETKPINLSLTPNPNDGQFYVFITAPKGFYGTLRILNVFGEEVYKNDVEGSEYKSLALDLASHPSGAYFVLLEGENQLASETVILK